MVRRLPRPRTQSAYIPLARFPSDAVLILLRQRAGLRLILAHAPTSTAWQRLLAKHEAPRFPWTGPGVLNNPSGAATHLARVVFGYADLVPCGAQGPYGLDFAAAQSGYGPALLRLAMAVTGERGLVVSRNEPTRPAVIVALRRLGAEPEVQVHRAPDAACVPRSLVRLGEADVRHAIYHATWPHEATALRRAGETLNHTLAAQGLDEARRTTLWEQAGTAFFWCRYYDEPWCAGPTHQAPSLSRPRAPKPKPRRVRRAPRPFVRKPVVTPRILAVVALGTLAAVAVAALRP